MKTKINIVRECSLFGINFDALNTTTQHCAHTFPIYHPRASDTCSWHNKMARCEIFIVQIAPERHLLSKIAFFLVHLVDGGKLTRQWKTTCYAKVTLQQLVKSFDQILSQYSQKFTIWALGLDWMGVLCWNHFLVKVKSRLNKFRRSIHKNLPFVLWVWIG